MSDNAKKKEEKAGSSTFSDSLIDDLVEATRLKPGDEAYSITRQGVKAFINEILEPQRSVEKVTQATVDEIIADLDKKLCRQVDAILHHMEFQKMESAWRSLKYLVDQTDFRENNRIEILNVSKQKLREDFEDAPEITNSGLYKIAYTNEFGQFGGQPYGSIIANYEMNPGAQDIKLLQSVASVASMAHAPFIAGAGPEFFGVDEFTLLGLLVLAFGGDNVTVDSGSGLSGDDRRAICRGIVEGGVLTADPDLLRQAARRMLIGVLSCRENRSQSGPFARIAGEAIGASLRLPNMATEDFLSCLSRTALEKAAAAEGVRAAPRARDTRTRMIERCAGGVYLHPAALFRVTGQELKDLAETSAEAPADRQGDAPDSDTPPDSADAAPRLAAE